MPFNKNDKANREDRADFKKKPIRRRKKVCIFCADKNSTVDYKDVKKLSKFISERGKLLPRRMTGACALHNRQITKMVKRARHIALLPYQVD